MENIVFRIVVGVLSLVGILSLAVVTSYALRLIKERDLWKATAENQHAHLEMERKQFRERLAACARLWDDIREERDTVRESRRRLVRAFRVAKRQRWACRCHADAPSIPESKAREIVVLLEKWESQGEGAKVVNLDFAKGIWNCLDELKDVLYAPSKGQA